MVEDKLVHEWVSDAAQLIAGHVVPLSVICDSMTSEDPQYFWKLTVSNKYTRRWVVRQYCLLAYALTHRSLQIAHKNSGDPVLVGSAGRVKECASRPHGNYIPGNQSVPEEYNCTKVLLYCQAISN